MPVTWLSARDSETRGTICVLRELTSHWGRQMQTQKARKPCDSAVAEKYEELWSHHRETEAPGSLKEVPPSELVHYTTEW